MKKVLSILLAITIAFTFTSCNGGGNKEVQGSDFKITVSNITATTAQIEIVPADTTALYFYDIYFADQFTKADLNIDTIAQISNDAIEYYMEMDEYEYDFEEYLSIGKISGKNGFLEGLTPETEFLVYAHKMDRDGKASGELSYVFFKTPKFTSIIGKKNVDMFGYYYDYIDEEGTYGLEAYDSTETYALFYSAEVKKLDETLTMQSFNGSYSYIFFFANEDMYSIYDANLKAEYNEEKDQLKLNGTIVASDSIEYTVSILAQEDEGDEGGEGDELAPKKTNKKFSLKSVKNAKNKFRMRK